MNWLAPLTAVLSHFLTIRMALHEEQMDKRGDGVISLEDFKSVLLERWAELKKANVASTPPAVSGRAVLSG